MSSNVEEILDLYWIMFSKSWKHLWPRHVPEVFYHCGNIKNKGLLITRQVNNQVKGKVNNQVKRKGNNQVKGKKSL